MKRTIILATALAALVLALTGCGTSDKLSTITLSASGSTGTFDVKGIGGTLQMRVTANYTSGKSVVVTNFSTFAATPEGTLDDGVTPLPTPPQTITISATGMVTAVDPPVCTFNVTSPAGVTPASYALSGDYKIVATYKGFQSQPAFLGVASAVGDGPNGACGP
ncbi:MAG: hypothetical protein WCA16_06100 [Candidatus Sulfotelmatobacter sp.]